MWIVMNERFRSEAAQFNLKECCEDCRHFCPERQKCGVMYPVTPHLQQSFAQAQDGERIYFCKMFEVNDA